MAGIEAIEAGFYRIPLEVPLTDSTHGEMLAFELNTVRLRDADGAEGVGYTYTCGRNGAAVDAILSRDIARAGGGAGRGPDRGAVAARVVGAALRRARRACSAGAVRAGHGALGHEGAAVAAAAVDSARRA